MKKTILKLALLSSMCLAGFNAYAGDPEPEPAVFFGKFSLAAFWNPLPEPDPVVPAPLIGYLNPFPIDIEPPRPDPPQPGKP